MFRFLHMRKGGQTVDQSEPESVYHRARMPWFDSGSFHSGSQFAPKVRVLVENWSYSSTPRPLTLLFWKQKLPVLEEVFILYFLSSCHVGAADHGSPLWTLGQFLLLATGFTPQTSVSCTLATWFVSQPVSFPQFNLLELADKSSCSSILSL